LFHDSNLNDDKPHTGYLVMACMLDFFQASIA